MFAPFGSSRTFYGEFGMENVGFALSYDDTDTAEIGLRSLLSQCAAARRFAGYAIRESRDLKALEEACLEMRLLGLSPAKNVLLAVYTDEEHHIDIVRTVAQCGINAVFRQR